MACEHGHPDPIMCIECHPEITNPPASTESSRLKEAIEFVKHCNDAGHLEILMGFARDRMATLVPKKPRRRLKTR